VAAGKELVLREVEIKGREIDYGNGKWAASQLRVISELEPVTNDCKPSPHRHQRPYEF
jgi:hypothetical protein